MSHGKQKLSSFSITSDKKMKRVYKHKCLYKKFQNKKKRWSLGLFHLQIERVKDKKE